MNSPTERRPAKLQFDFEQWRKDIQTFANETEHELQAIISELTGDEVELPFAAEKPFASHPAIIEETVTSDNSPATQRLASLRAKLAKRINQPEE